MQSVWSKFSTAVLAAFIVFGVVLVNLAIPVGLLALGVYVVVKILQGTGVI